jgi:electron transfer flavoprotein alpha/beta subunit
MLNILVCVKQVPDINLVKMDPVTGSLIRAGVPAILNPLDANALEAAVRVKEAHGGTITVITMGPDMAKEALRECLAAGADRAVLLSDRAFANADTLATSYVIVSAAKMLGEFDLIFCGKESLDGATGQMGSQLAERFGASQISSTSKIVEVDTENHSITAERDLERGVEVLKAQYPCLLTVEKANFRARIPNLKSWKASRTAEIEVYNSSTIPGLDFAQIGDPGSPTKVPRTYPPVTGSKGSIIDEGSTEKNVDKLIELISDVL